MKNFSSTLKGNPKRTNLSKAHLEAHLKAEGRPKMEE